jgi:hypothetical protein
MLIDDLLEYFASIALQPGPGIHPGLSLWYGFWPVRFELQNDVLVATEMGDSPTTFVPGVRRSVAYLAVQQSVCRSVDAPFEPPACDRTAVISAGVLGGDPVRGRRFEGKRTSSGWFLATAQYDDHLESTSRIHLYHLVQERSDLVGVFGLPPGGGFYQDSSGDHVYFDPIQDRADGMAFET